MKIHRFLVGIVPLLVVLAVSLHVSTPETLLRVIVLAWTPHYFGAGYFPRSDVVEVAIPTLLVPFAILGIWRLASAAIPKERASSSRVVRILVATGWIAAVVPLPKAAIDASVWAATSRVQTSIVAGSREALTEVSATRMLEGARDLTKKAYGLPTAPPPPGG